MSEKDDVVMLGSQTPEFQNAIGELMERALILLVKDAGGVVDIKVDRVDHETKGIKLEMEIVDHSVFRFRIEGM